MRKPTKRIAQVKKLKAKAAADAAAAPAPVDPATTTHASKQSIAQRLGADKHANQPAAGFKPQQGLSNNLPVGRMARKPGV